MLKYSWLLLCVLACCLSVSAHADTIDFSYSGTSPYSTDPFTGTGSFSYTTTSTTVALADLTSFSFTLDLTDPNLTGVFTFDEASLTSFNATVNAGQLVSLSLDTNYANAVVTCKGLCSVFPEEFHIVASTGSTCASCPDPQGQEYKTSSGPVVQTNFAPPATVPEPASLTLISTGALALVGVARRKLQGRVTHT
jgi:hypothetical protein